MRRGSATFALLLATYGAHLSAFAAVGLNDFINSFVTLHFFNQTHAAIRDVVNKAPGGGQKGGGSVEEEQKEEVEVEVRREEHNEEEVVEESGEAIRLLSRTQGAWPPAGS